MAEAPHTCQGDPSFPRYRRLPVIGDLGLAGRVPFFTTGALLLAGTVGLALAPEKGVVLILATGTALGTVLFVADLVVGLRQVSRRTTTTVLDAKLGQVHVTDDRARGRCQMWSPFADVAQVELVDGLPVARKAQLGADLHRVIRIALRSRAGDELVLREEVVREERQHKSVRAELVAQALEAAAALNVPAVEIDPVTLAFERRHAFRLLFHGLIVGLMWGFALLVPVAWIHQQAVGSGARAALPALAVQIWLAVSAWAGVWRAFGDQLADPRAPAPLARDGQP